MAEPIWQIVWKNVSSLLGRSWTTWRALTRAGQSTMLFVLGRVDLLDGVTMALEDASISWLLGLSPRSCSPPALVMTGCPCCFFPLGNESFHLCQRTKTHTHTHTHIFEIILSSTTLVGILAEIWNLPSWERAKPDQRYWLMSYWYFTLCVDYIP
jgi:hypothetical protein